MGNKVTQSRKIVLDMLIEIRSSNTKCNVLLKNVLDKYDYIDSRDKAFIKKLFIGCIQHRITLDYIIDTYSKSKKLKPVIRDILRMGVYQIIYMDAVPDSAACNEAANLAISKGLSGLRGFVNGVLRNISREKESIHLPDDISVKYSVPEWIAEYLTKHFSMAECEAMLKDSLRNRDITIRVNESLEAEDKDKLIRDIEAAGVSIIKHPYLEYAYNLSGVQGMENVPGFYEGLVTVQDVSSQLAIEVAGIKSGDYVIDMCAAPGGKTVHAALKCGADGTVDSRDLTDNKVALIEENADRLNLGNVIVKVSDATVLDESVIDKADVVICDLPCSGLGDLGRKADLKYNVTYEAVQELQSLQREILKNAYRYVKKGGILIYSTCTITSEEDEDNYRWIANELSLKPVSITDNLPEELRSNTTNEGFIKLLPGIHKCDGFFISKFIKE